MDNGVVRGSGPSSLTKQVRAPRGRPRGMKAPRILSVVVFVGYALSSNAVGAFHRSAIDKAVRRRVVHEPPRHASPSLLAASMRPPEYRPAEQDTSLCVDQSGKRFAPSIVGKAVSSILLAGTMLFTCMGGPQPASAGLLDEFGADGSQIKDRSASVEIVKKGKNAIDPTLRSSYYYPTAKKRYLPRIQRVSREILSVPDQLASGDWGAVQSFASTADNAILPLQLYVSSLDGQGLSMKNQYAIQMKRDAQDFEKSYNTLQAAIQRHDQDQAMSAILNMGLAVADYRQQGRLSDDDGYIPSIDDMRRMAMRRPTVKVVVP